MEVVSIYKKVGTDIRYILLNSSNNEFASAMALPGVLNYFPTLETRCNVPDFAVKGTDLTTNLLEGTAINRPICT